MPARLRWRVVRLENAPAVPDTAVQCRNGSKLTPETMRRFLEWVDEFARIELEQRRKETRERPALYLVR
jgi:hypothetical protein